MGRRRAGQEVRVGTIGKYKVLGDAAMVQRHASVPDTPRDNFLNYTMMSAQGQTVHSDCKTIRGNHPQELAALGQKCSDKPGGLGK